MEGTKICTSDGFEDGAQFEVCVFFKESISYVLRLYFFMYKEIYIEYSRYCYLSSFLWLSF